MKFIKKAARLLVSLLVAFTIVSFTSLLYGTITYWTVLLLSALAIWALWEFSNKQKSVHNVGVKVLTSALRLVMSIAVVLLFHVIFDFSGGGPLVLSAAPSYLDSVVYPFLLPILAVWLLLELLVLVRQRRAKVDVKTKQPSH